MECLGRKQKELYCSAKLLDEAELNLDVQKNTKGSVLLDRVYERLNLLEADYFGLRYLDSQNQTHWLDPNKAISKQIKNGPPYMLYFGVKFYMENPCKLKEEVTRYQFFLQLRMDMLQGRLPCSFHAAAELCAYATQSELGDFDPARHSGGYISEFRFIPSQTPELEQHIMELHKKLKGLSPSKAELSFLERARWLDMYGVDLHPVLGDNNVEFFLGLTPTGVVVYKNKTKVARYYWPRISKVHFKDTEFTLVVQNTDGDEDDCVFKLSTRSACKHLWKCCVEQHAFFRLPQAGDEPIHPRKLSFSGSSFRHTGRTQREALEASSELSRPEQQVTRAPSRKYNRRLSQTDMSLKNVASDDHVFVDDNPASPNGILLRLSPQPAHRLSSHRRQSGRDSPTSGMSTRSVPWEDAEQARMGLFTPPGSSPVSVRSSASRHRHRARSKSPGPSHRHGDRSESESEAAYSSRRRRRRSVVSSDGGSDHDSHHHHQHRKRRSRSRGPSSGSESEFSKHDDDRRRRRRERMVNSEEQWKAREEKKIERGELREGQDITVKRLRDGAYVDNPADVEFQKHIKKDLVDSAQYTEEERRNIPYTNVVTDSTTTNGHHRHHRHGHSRSRSKKSEDFSDGTASERSTRQFRKPDGTPPPPYSQNGANRRIDPPHKVKDTQLDSRGDPDKRGDVLIQNGDINGSSPSGYLTSGGGLFGGRHQINTNQNQRLHNHTTVPSIHTNGTHDRHTQRYPPTHQGSPTLGIEGLCVTHSREDSGLGNEHDYTLSERQTTAQILRRNVHDQNDPSGDVTDLRSTSQVITSKSERESHPSASQGGTRRHQQNTRTEVTQSNGQSPARSHVHNGGSHYPQKLRLPHSTNKLNQDVTLKGAPIILNNNTEVTEKRSDHLWSEPLEPRHSCKTSSLVDERDMQIHRNTAGNQGDTVSDELPDFPPGYKPNYSRGIKRYSLTTQEMIRVSTLDGDHHDLRTEL